MDTDTLLTLDNIGFRIGDKTILHDVSFSLHDNEIITIVGPNGAGKSTLLSLALGLQTPTAGRVIQHRALRIGYVPQFINRDETMPMTVRDFVKLTKSPFSEATMRALFEELDLTRMETTILNHLSGGELRRVLLARALLSRPDILMLDEPTAGVDVAGQVAFYRRLSEWRERQHFAILMVSHDLHLVMGATDRVICLNKHICCQGEPVHVLQNEHYVALFGHSHLSEEAELSFYQHGVSPSCCTEGAPCRHHDVHDSGSEEATC